MFGISLVGIYSNQLGYGTAVSAGVTKIVFDITSVLVYIITIVISEVG